MPNHTTNPHLNPFTLASIALALSLIPTVAFADQGRVHLEDGSTIQGEIVTYDPGVGVTVQMANGSTIELSADDVARVEIGTDPAPAPEAAATAPAPPPTVAPSPAPAPYAAPAPMTPSPNGRRPGIAGPITMGAIGLGLAVIGAPIYTTSFRYNPSYEYNGQGIAGLTLLSIGGALAVSGFGIFLGLRVKKRRLWDRENRVALELAPTISRHHGGLSLSGTF